MSEDLESKIKLLEIELNRHDKNIENLTSIVQICQMNDATTSIEIKQILAGISELKTSVSELKEKPAKRWDKIIISGISALVSGAIGIFIGLFSGK